MGNTIKSAYENTTNPRSDLRGGSLTQQLTVGLMKAVDQIQLDCLTGGTGSVQAWHLTFTYPSCMDVPETFARCALLQNSLHDVLTTLITGHKGQLMVISSGIETHFYKKNSGKKKKSLLKQP